MELVFRLRNHLIVKRKRKWNKVIKFGVYIVLVLIGSLLGSCSLTNRLTENELLIAKSSITYTHPVTVKKKQRLRSELSSFAKPKPNSGLFKMKLRLYNSIKEPKKNKGLKYWLKYKLGERPALYKKSQLQKNQLFMEKHLTDQGFFNSAILVDTTVRNKKVAINYLVDCKGQYQLNQIIYPSDSSDISFLIKEYQDKSFLKSGANYQKSNLDKERSRLTKIMNDKGFFDFSSDYINFFIDTVKGNLLTDVYVNIEPLPEGKPHKTYSIDETYVVTNYDLKQFSNTAQDTILSHPKFNIVEDQRFIRPTVLRRMILQNPADIFSKEFQNASLNHLLDLGTFKFVNLKYIKYNDSLGNRLDRIYYMTPDLVQDIKVDLELNNRTGGYYGTVAAISYLHKNLFYGAEKLDARLSSGIETQVGNQLSFINTLDFNLQLKYSVPKFVAPFRFKQYSGYHVPHTSVSLINNFQKREGFYSIFNTSILLGYEWKETNKKLHQLNPIDFQIVRVFNTSNEFEALLKENNRLEQSFENTFIAGLNYIYNYSNQSLNEGRNSLFFRGEFKLTGNLFYLYSKLVQGNVDQAYELFGLPFSQFIRLQTDVRLHKRLRNNNLVGRIAPGIAIPYGNSSVLPYNEQFYIGGANSIRAFKLRGLGPGGFVPPEINQEIDEQFLDQTGDIRLEMNLEYRFDLIKYLKGAVFIDAGNIWLLKSDETPEGVFHFNQFIDEIAIGSGVGLRLDFEFAVIRMDLGIALRKPYLDRGFRWSFDQWDFKNRAFRKDHLNLVFGIGYPF